MNQIQLYCEQMTTTDLPHKQSTSMINKIIAVQNEELQDEYKQKVKQRLLWDAEYLLEKKKRQEEKRQKIKKMQSNYIQQVEAKRKAMTDKQTKSYQFRVKQKSEQDKKLKYKSICYQKVVDQIQNNNKKQIRSALKLQKQFNNKIASHTARFSSRDHGTSLISSRKSQPVREQELKLSVEEKMSRIVEKTNKAQKLHEYLNNVMVEKFRMRARLVEETQQKVFHRSLIEQSEKYRSIYEKNDEIEKLNQRSRCQMQKKHNEKAKSMKEKLNKYIENLKELSTIEKERNKKLDKKFNRKNTPKQWKDERIEKYKQRFMINSKRIDEEKQLKAEQILHKHQQISLENRIYKEQKDKLIQAVKFSI